MCLHSPKNALHSLLAQEAPGFPVAPDFSSLEVWHLKFLQDFAVGGRSSYCDPPSRLLPELCHLGLLTRWGGSRLVSL